MMLSDEQFADCKSEMDSLLEADDWLRKIDRSRRIGEMRHYIDKFVPEIKDRAMYGFLDIGPGPGEMIELAMGWAMDAYGWDAETPEGGMGSNYLRYSMLSHLYRGLDVTYCNDFAPIQSRFNGSLSVINLRGSIEQVLASCLNGSPHDEHHDCRKLTWDLKRGREGLSKFLRCMRASLFDTNGILMIAANGASNTDWYDRVLMSLAEPCGFSRVKRFDDRNHKFYV
jgi:hypothetical protein